MLWAAAPAGASTIPYASPRDGAAASFVQRPLLVEGISEDYAGVLGNILEDPVLFYARRAPPYTILGVGSNPWFGRNSLPYLPGVRSPGTLGGTLGRPVLYHPLVGLPGFRGNYVYNVLRPALPMEDTWSNVLFRRRLADLSWRSLRDLAGLPLPDPYDPESWPYVSVPNFVDRRDATLTTLRDPGAGLELLQLGPGGEALALFPGLDQGAGWRATSWLRTLPYAEQDFGGASVVVNAAPIPEPATGVLLLAGLCALSARRRSR